MFQKNIFAIDKITHEPSDLTYALNFINIYPFQHPKEYQNILDSSKGSNAEKRLGATFIPRFFKYFPDNQLNALNCLLDLCEDEDSNVSNLEKIMT